MKIRICKILGLVFFLSSTLANAQTKELNILPWIALSSSFYALAPADGQKIFLSVSIDANTHKLAINLLNLTITDCKEGMSYGPTAIAPVSVNGQFLKFVQGCINGNGLQQPETVQGKQFLYSKVESGAPVTIDMGTGIPLQYPSSNFTAIKSRFQQVQNAM